MIISRGGIVVPLITLLLVGYAAPLLSGTKEEALFEASEQGRYDLAQRLLGNGASPNARDRCGLPVLMIAIDKKRDSLAELLLDCGADPDIRYVTTKKCLFGGSWLGDCPMALAITLENLTIVKKLLSKGSDPNQLIKGEHLLFYALWKDNFEIVKVLWDSGSRTDVNEALLIGCHSHDPRIAALFLNNGANINFRGKDGSTPIIIAAKYLKTQLLTFLLEKGADPNIEDGSHKRALNYAHYNIGRYPGAAEIVDLLKKAGAQE
jgi:ankyrin repeat protein